MFEFGKTYKGEIVPKKTKWIFSLSGIGREAIFLLVGTFLLTYLLEGGILSDNPKQYLAMNGVLTILIIAYRLLNAFFDPIMGVIIEKTHFKSGKYKPWIFIGSVTNTACLLALFCTPALFPWCRGWVYVGWFAVFYLLWCITFSINDISFWGMLPSLSSDEKQRSKITSIFLISSYAGSFTLSIFIPELAKASALSTDAFWIMSLVVGAFFVLGQTSIFLFCQEKDRDIEFERRKPPVRFKDMVTIFKTNDQVRVMIIAFLCYFLSFSVLTALMQNIFYISIGFNAGKTMMTAFNAITNINMIIPCFLAPYLCKKFSKMKVFKISYGIMIIGLIIFFFYGMPVQSGTLGTITQFLSPIPTINGDLNFAYSSIYCVITAIIFLAQGLAFNVVISMINSCIEYNDYISGERKEAVISSLKPLTSKLATSIQQGISFGALAITGVASIMAKINEINSKGYDGKYGPKEQALEEACKVATYNQIWGLKAFCVVIPIVLSMICWFLISKRYKIDEKMYQEMCDHIAKRNNQK